VRAIGLTDDTDDGKTEETDKAREGNWNSPTYSLSSTPELGAAAGAGRSGGHAEQRNAVISHLLCPGETELEIGGPGAVRVELAASHPRIGKQALHLQCKTL